jgi:archaellum biogenesis protein FlaJ (TadC family)
LPFFHIFQIISLFSSIFSKSFHYSTYLSSIFSKSFHSSTYLSSIFSNVFQLSETSINSYDISFMYKLPWYSCNIVEDIYLPTYLSTFYYEL